MLEWAASLGTLLLLVLWSYKKHFYLYFSAAVPAKTVGEPKEDYKLICKPSALANYLLRQCRTFCAFSNVTWVWRTFPSLQTVVAVLGPVDKGVHFVREYLQLTDDGLVALDWAVKPGHHQRRRRTSSNSTVPILLVIPNSVGKITRNISKVGELSLHELFMGSCTRMQRGVHR